MKTAKYTILFSIISLFILTGEVLGRDKIAVPLSNPGQPGQLSINMVRGSLTVTGYDGEEVVIRSHGQELADQQNEESRDGLRRLSSSSSGFNIRENNNNVDIEGVSPIKEVTFDIMVPNDFSLKLNIVQGDDLLVENVNGSMEINHVNGDITLNGVGGSAMISTVNGDISASFQRVTPDKPMAFSNVNGDIDISLPANTGFAVKMKTEWGDLFTDFDMENREGDHISESTDADEYYVEVNNWFEGDINGGGPEYLFKTLRGDIYLRKR